MSIRHILRALVDAMDPVRLPAYLPLKAPSTDLVCVYRKRNTSEVLRLVRQIRSLGGDCYLWALDAITPVLADETVGFGPGGRFSLLNRLAAQVPAGRWLLVSDDDVRMPNLRGFLAMSARHNLGLAQPAHARRRSHFFHPIVERQPYRIGRATTFVEIGPLFVVSAAARADFLPFPEEGMGYGTELLWYDRYKAGAQLGIIDATPMRHLSPAGKDYDWAAEDVRQRELMRARGLSGWPDVQRVLRNLY